MAINNFNGATWRNKESVISFSFVCWNCNNNVASEKGYRTEKNTSKKMIYICPHCKAPNVFDANGKAILSPLLGKEIKKLPENIESVYSEIRKSLQSECFNGAILLMRKLIMHIAVEEGAKEGKTFVEYIDYLYDNGNIPKKSKSKSDSVRTLGNNANHKIENRTQEEAFNCFGLVELLLKLNYEFADEGGENGN